MQNLSTTSVPEFKKFFFFALFYGYSDISKQIWLVQRSSRKKILNIKERDLYVVQILARFSIDQK